MLRPVSGLMLQPCLLNLTAILQKCKQQTNLPKTLNLHAYMKRNGLNTHTALLSDHANPTAAAAAATITMDHIKGFIRSGECQKALNIYKSCRQQGKLPCCLNSHIFGSLLKCCAKMGDLETGIWLHSDVVEQGILEHDVFLGSAVVDMYAKCGSIMKSQEAFDMLTLRDVVSWTALIRGYIEENLMLQALCCFEAMCYEGISPDDITFVCALRACGSIGSARRGREMHAQLMKQGLEKDMFVGNTLIDVYAKCGAFSDAQYVFHSIPTHDVVSWNAIIAGYAENGCGEEALYCFSKMQRHGISPQAFTYVSCIKACASIGIISIAEEIHSEVRRQGLEENLFVGCTLVDMYAKLGFLERAQDVFDVLPERNVVSWTTLIAAYVEHGQFEASMNCFETMQYEGITAVSATFVNTLKACGAMGVISNGWKSHADIIKLGLEKNLIVGSSLVDMYTKHASLQEAQEVFDNLPMQDVVSWTTLIAGYAQLGKSEHVFHMFDRMVRDGLKPNLVTFDNILSACNHAGLVEKGQMYFECMSKDYGIIPSNDHLICVADLFSRSGDIGNVVVMIRKMPFHPSTPVLHTLMVSCQKWGHVNFARQTFDHLLALDDKDASAYVSLSNIYADICIHECYK